MAGTPPKLDECLAAVGKVTHMESTVDLVLLNAFVVLSGCTHIVGRAIWYAGDASAVRHNLLSRVAEVSGDGAEREIVQNLITASKKATKNRNELAHSIFSTDDTGKGSFRSIRPKLLTQPHKPVTDEYIASLVSAVGDGLELALVQYRILCHKRKIPVQLTAV